MKKRILTLLAATVILFSFAACSKAGTETTTANTAVSTTVENTTAAATAPTTPVGTNQTEAKTEAPTIKTATTAAPTTQAPSPTSAVKAFTKTELAKFDGKSGRDAYIAYEGTVYDVTDISLWDSGVHHGLIAGTDLTAQVNSCDQHAITFMKAQFSTYPKVRTYTG